MGKKWSRPECKKIKLVPEEAVLWGCKQASGAIARVGFAGTCIVLFDSCVSTTS